jgi:hypothetical protein
MRTIEVNLYQFDELSDEAKGKARDWFRELEAQDFDAYGELWEPAEAAAKLLGITFAKTAVNLVSGKTRYESDIRYSGFSSQGDGASFVGSYEYAKGSTKAVRKEFPEDADLHAIADALAAIQRKHGYLLTADISQSGSYVHKYTMDVEVSKRSNMATLESEDTHMHDAILESMRDFAQWIYDGLRDEYEYCQSDEAVDEGIRANEYEFTEDGKRA